MQLGMIGLGRMGANIVRRVMRKGHECVVYDRDPQAVKTLAGEGATGVEIAKAARIHGRDLSPQQVYVVGDTPRRPRHHDRRCQRPLPRRRLERRAGRPRLAVTDRTLPRPMTQRKETE
jgi:hypothetical protein